MNTTRQLCTFRVDKELFGIEIEEIREIIRDQATTSIPLAPSSVAGLINLRGQIVPVVELRRCLALPVRRAESEPAILVVTTDSGVVGLRVDEIGDVLAVESDDREETPTNVQGALRRLLRHVYKLDRGLLLVLSVRATIEHSLSEGFRAGGPNARPEIHA